VRHANTAPLWGDPVEFDQLEPRESCTRELAGRISRISAPVFDGDAVERLQRARAHEAEAAARVERLNALTAELALEWRAAELKATAASLRGAADAPLCRSIAALYRVRLDSLAEQTIAAETSLELAQSARIRLDAGRRLRALLGLFPLVFMALAFGGCAAPASHTVSSEVADLYAEVRAEGVALGLPFDAPACDELPAEVFASGDEFTALCGKQASSPHDKCGDVGSCAWSCLITNEDGAPLIVIAAGWHADDASSVPGWTTGSLREVRALAMVQALKQCSGVGPDSLSLTDIEHAFKTPS
jgi:hypothetical protein